MKKNAFNEGEEVDALVLDMLPTAELSAGQIKSELARRRTARLRLRCAEACSRARYIAGADRL